MREIISFLKEWQTLIAGLIAIGAAFIGGGFINKQIRSFDNAEADRRKRKFAAARAILPLALSVLSNYSEETIQILKSILATRQDQTIPHRQDRPEFPKFPPSVIADLRDMIEFSDEPIRSALSALLAVLQIQTSRLTQLSHSLLERSGTLVTATNVERYIIQTAEIYARCAQLFNFARGELDHVPTTVSNKGIHSALNQCDVWVEYFPSIHGLADRDYGEAQ